MSRALILADLHWDHWRQASVDPFAGLGLDYWDSLDLVILAGDISNKAFIRWPQVFAWFAERMDLAKLHVFPGNHDPYGGKIDREDKLITACEQAGVGYAQRKVIQLGNHRFLCCTLWTDMMLGGDRDINMTKAERVMNDYRLIRVASDGYRRLQPRDTVALHRTDLAWLEAELATPFCGETVVVTHHAPIPPKPSQDMDAAYGSDLTALIARYQPKVWLFGHTHRAQQRVIGRTEIRNISLGYPDEWTGQNAGLTPLLKSLVLTL
ncbi:metallophosphoesterase [Tabrizicola aquatica]|uniref:metallophosphoesterase n=1 Tax=Tabrizicola aquatica TaxID=909926 RepID=UPI000CD18715|nr:metallophosphoesterase [Tabrizicola aquatica]